MSNALSLTNDWGVSKLSTRYSTVDDLVQKYNLKELDFIKIDTDGDDFRVLMSATDVINFSPLLGIYIEINFIGNGSEPNSFHNIDKTMRMLGFELFDICDITKYSSAALPTPYQNHGFANNIYGRILQANALYLRDPCTLKDIVWSLPLIKDDKRMVQDAHKNCSAITAVCPELSPDKLLKLACLFEIFNMPDHAAEILITFRDELENLIDVNENLDILTKELTGKDITYSDYISSLTEESLLPNQIFGIQK